MDQWLSKQKRSVRRLRDDLPEWYNPRELFTVDDVTEKYDGEYARATIRKSLATLSRSGFVEIIHRHGKNLYSLRRK